MDDKHQDDQIPSTSAYQSIGINNEENESNTLPVDSIRRYLAEKLSFFRDISDTEEDKGIQVLETVDFKGLVKHWKSGGFKKIVTMVGAGISTSAGIPDFRTPGTGLYDNFQSYNLPYPSAIFEIDYLLANPKPFFALAKDLYPGSFKPTPCHYFIKLLDEKGLLQRHYTQNIDTLERIAGITPEKIVECHGTFFTNHCMTCRKEYTMTWMKEKIFQDVIPTCECCGIVKPDIIFFGESLPDNFYVLPMIDFKECDLLIIMGTSLEVQPFASLVERVNRNCVRLLINREPVGKNANSLRSLFFGQGLSFDEPGNKRDIALIDDCDNGVLNLATELGLREELENLVIREHNQIDMNTVSSNMSKLEIDSDRTCGGNTDPRL